MKIPRSTGIILHITSLPSPFGIGDLGPSAYRFADFLEASSTTFWQILPLNYTEEGSGFSPYSGVSAFAGNIWVISPELLMEEGLLEAADLQMKKAFSETEVEFAKVLKLKNKLFDKAFERFLEMEESKLHDEFEAFFRKNNEWLEDYALYRSLKDYFDGKSWAEWPGELKDRKADALENIKALLQTQIKKEAFLQFIFFRQWSNLVEYCKAKNIRFIGDLPFYVGYDSCDVWCYPQYFKLDDKKKPLLVAGVPPDYFSETGQLWGMPVFDWDNLKRDKYSWWLKRIEQNLKMYHILRLDHFRAFSAYWEVPAEEITAIHGSWTKGPGKDFFKVLKREYPDLPFIAEDLGEIDQPVRDLMKQFDLPGMRVLQFAFGDDMSKNSHIPHHYTRNSIAYTGTHDNNTIQGWYQNDLAKSDRKRISEYLNKKTTKETVHWDLIQLALQSVAQLAVFPVQDLFGLGQESIMNKPSTVEGNWSWRIPEKYFTAKISEKLNALAELYDRSIKTGGKESSAKKVKTRLKQKV